MSEFEQISEIMKNSFEKIRELVHQYDVYDTELATDRLKLFGFAVRLSEIEKEAVKEIRKLLREKK